MDNQLLLMSFEEDVPLYAAEVRLHILKHPVNRAGRSKGYLLRTFPDARVRRNGASSGATQSHAL